MLRILDVFLKGICCLLGMNSGTAVSCRLREVLRPVASVELSDGSGQLRFSCPNSTALWRVKSLYRKEPETIEWIDSFKDDDVLLDIGANVGLYTVYAAKLGHPVVSIEPESQNYCLLNENLYLNKLGEKVFALNLGIGKDLALTKLFLSRFEPASALHTVGEPRDYLHRPFDPPYQQSILTLSIDRLLSFDGMPFPTHIKIDVDGSESEVICGAVETMKDRRVGSLLIELNEDLKEDLDLIEFIKSCGFTRFSRHQSELIEAGPFRNTFNYIFRKESE